MLTARIELFDELRLIQDGRVTTRFQTRKTASLLAFLAYHPGRLFGRDFLAELLWQEDSPSSRHKLRMALSALRDILEPPGTPRGALIQSDRLGVSITQNGLSTDVLEFEAALAESSAASTEADRAQALAKAVAHYRGDLLRDLDEEWIIPERRRHEEACLLAIRRLIRCLAAQRELDRAIAYARRAVGIDPLREEAQRDLMRLLAATGQSSAALRQYREVEDMLRAEFQGSPSPSTVSLARQISESCAKGSKIIRRHDSAVESPQAAPAAGPNLPLTLTRFFGRQSETAALIDLLAPDPDDTPVPRLVTLTGPGGSGKTRLAIEVAGRNSDRFDQCVCFVSLADLSDARLIPQAIEQALRLPQSMRGDALDRVVEALSGRKKLLILDNFEHLLGVNNRAARADSAVDGLTVVSALLSRATGLVILATSRRPLGIAGEREFFVGPLPSPETSASLGALAACESVQLFIDRCSSMRAGIELTSRNARVLAEICNRLEGIPLAIELAASRARVMSLDDINTQLEQRLDLLVTRRRDVPERHRSLRAAVRWSYDQLPHDARELFARASVFRGGFTAESVADICLRDEAKEENGTDEAEGLILRAHSALEELCESSLVFAETRGDRVRFRMLETIREFAAEQIDEPRAEWVRALHAAYYSGKLPTTPAVIHLRAGPETDTWIEEESANLLAALDWSTRHDPRAALDLGVGLVRYWWLRGGLNEGRARLGDLIKYCRDQGPTPALARALRAAGRLAVAQGDDAVGMTLYEESLGVYTALDDERGSAEVNSAIAVLENNRGDHAAARARLEDSLGVLRRLGDRPGMASTINTMGLVRYETGDFDGARASFEESLSIWRELDDPERGTPLSNLGMVAMAQDRYADARAHYEEGLEVRTRENHRLGIAHSWHNLAGVSLAEGDWQRATELFFRALGQFQDIGAWSLAMDSLDSLAHALIAAGRSARAARYLGASDAFRERVATPRHDGDRRRYLDALARLKRALDAESFDRAYVEGRGLTPEQAIAELLRD